MKKNILVILGHPDTNSFCGSLIKAYIDSAKLCGLEVRELQLGHLMFDPIKGSSQQQREKWIARAKNLGSKA